MHVSINSMIVCVSIFSGSFSVRMYYCAALSTVFDLIFALQVFIIITHTLHTAHITDLAPPWFQEISVLG